MISLTFLQVDGSVAIGEILGAIRKVKGMDIGYIQRTAPIFDLDLHYLNRLSVSVSVWLRLDRSECTFDMHLFGNDCRMFWRLVNDYCAQAHPLHQYSGKNSTRFVQAVVRRRIWVRHVPFGCVLPEILIWLCFFPPSTGHSNVVGQRAHAPS